VRTVKVRLREADLSREMAAMREWLDRHRYEARSFNCTQRGDEVVASVEFTNNAAADAFAAQFDVKGHQLRPDGDVTNQIAS
jgi:hypothetical protein